MPGGRLVLECILFVSCLLSRRVRSSEISHSHDELQTTAQSWLALKRARLCQWWDQSSDNDPDLAAMNSFLTTSELSSVRQGNLAKL